VDKLTRFVVEKASAQVAQLVEQRTENPRVPGSIPGLGTAQSDDDHQRVPGSTPGLGTTHFSVSLVSIAGLGTAQSNLG
jgi:hypothetical protein